MSSSARARSPAPRRNPSVSLRLARSPGLGPGLGRGLSGRLVGGLGPRQEPRTSPGSLFALSATATAQTVRNTHKNQSGSAVTLHALSAAMSNRRRIQIAGLTQHVMNRGTNRCDIFRADKDYAFF